MAFPDVPRVLYAVNTLDEVLCQLRFPPILRIDAETPVGFQEAIRVQYPLYEAKPALRIPTGMPSEFAQILGAELPLVGPKSHEFASRDRVWSVNLNRQFLALTCKTYERWEEFRERLVEASGALAREYAPSFYTRLGLRYRNVIRRSRLPEKDPPWKWNELIQPWVAGLLGPLETDEAVEDTRTTTHLALPDGIGRCILNCGLATDEHDQELVFQIDADCYTDQQTELPDALPRLDAFNRQARLLFRWCTTERLHDALGPQTTD
jgi:uncharacterized protein (TIGR04255 family)